MQKTHQQLVAPKQVETVTASLELAHCTDERAPSQATGEIVPRSIAPVAFNIRLRKVDFGKLIPRWWSMILRFFDHLE